MATCPGPMVVRSAKRWPSTGDSRRLPARPARRRKLVRSAVGGSLRKRLVSQQEAAPAEGSLLQELEPQRVGARLEERISLSQRDRHEADAVLVKEAVADQRVAEVRAAEDEQVLAGLLFQPRHGGPGVLLDQYGVVPVGPLERPREDELRDRVHEVRDLVRGLGPVGRHPLVRAAPEDEGPYLLCLLERELTELLAPGIFQERDVPRGRTLEHSVQRDQVPH